MYQKHQHARSVVWCRFRTVFVVVFDVVRCIAHRSPATEQHHHHGDAQQCQVSSPSSMIWELWTSYVRHVELGVGLQKKLIAARQAI